MVKKNKQNFVTLKKNTKQNKKQVLNYIENDNTKESCTTIHFLFIVTDSEKGIMIL